MPRTTASPNPDQVRHEVLLALQSLLQVLENHYATLVFWNPQNCQQEIDPEQLRWSGSPTKLCTFKDGLTAEQVTNSLMLKLDHSQFTLYNRFIIYSVYSLVILHDI
jgi:hypothetical protein